MKTTIIALLTLLILGFACALVFRPKPSDTIPMSGASTSTPADTDKALESLTAPATTTPLTVTEKKALDAALKSLTAPEPSPLKK